MSKKKDRPIYTACAAGLATIWGGIADCLTLEKFRASGQRDVENAGAERYHSAGAGGCGDFVDLSEDGLEACCRGFRRLGGTCPAGAAERRWIRQRGRGWKAMAADPAAGPERVVWVVQYQFLLAPDGWHDFLLRQSEDEARAKLDYRRSVSNLPVVVYRLVRRTIRDEVIG